MAGDFDGAGDSLDSVNNSTISGDDVFSMSIWFDHDVNAADGVLSTGDVNTALKIVILFLDALGDGAISMEFAGGNGFRSGTGEYSSNVFNNFIGVKTAGAINTTSTMYLNGSVVSGSGSANTPNIANQAAVIGQSENTDDFDGQLFHGFIWDVELSAAEAAAIANGVHPFIIRNSNIVAACEIFEAGATQSGLGRTAGNFANTGTTSIRPNPPVQLLQMYMP